MKVNKSIVYLITEMYCIFHTDMAENSKKRIFYNYLETIKLLIT